VQNEPHYVTLKPDNRKTYIPVWITDPFFSHIKIKKNPTISIKALYEVKRLLYTAFLKTDDKKNELLNGEAYEKAMCHTAGTIQDNRDPGRDDSKVKTTTSKRTTFGIDSGSMGKTK
jgi:hypothetical protein